MVAGVRVNAVSPDPIDTPIDGKTGLPADHSRPFASSSPARLPRPHGDGR